MKTKYDFNKIKLCDNLDENKLKKLGFTNYYKPNWCFDRTISSEKYKTGTYKESFILRISNNFKDLDVDFLDETICQPCIPYCEYYLSEKSLEELTPYIQNGIKKCDEYIKFLIDNKVIYFEE